MVPCISNKACECLRSCLLLLTLLCFSGSQSLYLNLTPFTEDSLSCWSTALFLGSDASALRPLGTNQSPVCLGYRCLRSLAPAFSCPLSAHTSAAGQTVAVWWLRSDVPSLLRFQTASGLCLESPLCHLRQSTSQRVAWLAHLILGTWVPLALGNLQEQKWLSFATVLFASPSVPTGRWHQTCSCRCHLLVADGVDTVSCSYLGEASKLSVTCVCSVQFCTRSPPLSCFSHVSLPSVCPGCCSHVLLRSVQFVPSSQKTVLPHIFRQGADACLDHTPPTSLRQSISLPLLLLLLIAFVIYSVSFIYLLLVNWSHTHPRISAMRTGNKDLQGQNNACIEKRGAQKIHACVNECM